MTDARQVRVSVNWLDHSKTLREQGIDENETLLLRRNGDVSTINTTTSVELEKLRNEIAVSRSCMFKRDQALRGTRGRFLCASLTQQPTNLSTNRAILVSVNELNA